MIQKKRSKSTGRLPEGRLPVLSIGQKQQTADIINMIKERHRQRVFRNEERGNEKWFTEIFRI